MLWLFAATKDV